MGAPRDFESENRLFTNLLILKAVSLNHSKIQGKKFSSLIHSTPSILLDSGRFYHNFITVSYKTKTQTLFAPRRSGIYEFRCGNPFWPDDPVPTTGGLDSHVERGGQPFRIKGNPSPVREVKLV